jgi:hypothetical protein
MVTVIDGAVPFEDAVAEAQADIASSLERAGLRDDPYRYPLAALSTALSLFPEFLRQMDATAARARTPLDAAALERLEKAAAHGAARYAGDLARTQLRRTALISGCILAGCVLIASALTGMACYRWGKATAIAGIHETEGGLEAAFRNGPDAASGWVRLMRLNDLPRVLAVCTGGRAFTDPATGRRACLAPLWLDDEQAAAPPRAQRVNTK